MNGIVKRIVCFLMTLAAALPLAACGGGPTTQWGGGDVTDDSVPEAYTLPFGEGKTVTYSGPDNWYAPASLSKNLEVWREVERRTGVKIKWQVQASNQWNVSMLTKINAGDKLPDMMGLPNWHDADIDRFAKEKIIIPLNELINKYAPNIKRILKENPDIRKQMTAADGNIYSIDEFFEANEFYNSVIIRKDWLEKVGYESGWAPKTKEEFVEVMRRFKSQISTGTGNPVIPLAAMEGGDYEFLCSGFSLSAPLQNTVIDEKGNAVYQRATPEYGEFLGWLQGLYSEGLMFQDYQAGNQTAFEALIARNQVGITVASGSIMAKYNAILAGYNNGGEYIMIDPPVDDEGNLTLVKRDKLGGQIGISYDCKDPVTVIRLMDYLWGSNEGNILMHYGIEGKTYTEVEGQPVLTDWVMNNPDGLDPGSALRSLGAWPPLLDRQTRDFMCAFQPRQVVDYVNANLAAGKYVEPFPKILATKEERAETSKYATALNTYQQENAMKFILGDLSIAKYQTDYMRQMEKLGLRKFEEARKRQYERFCAL